MNFNLFIPLAYEDSIPKWSQEKIKLNDNGIDEKGVGKGRPGVIFDEGHQETKANEHHDIDVLIHWVVVGIDGRVFVSIGTNKNAVQYDNKNLNDDE